MKEVIQYPVIFEGKEYKSIIKFDCVVVKLKTDFNDFMTKIPISPKVYRETKQQTKAKVVITQNKDWTQFEIYDDYGICSNIIIHNTLKKKIEFAKNAAIKQGLLSL